MKKLLYHIAAFSVILACLIAFYVATGLDTCWYEISVLLTLGRLIEKTYKYIGDIK